MQIKIERFSPKQEQFLLSHKRYVGYGGARGGGKSWSVRTKAKLLALKHGGIRILIMRRSYPELRENHILPLMAELKGAAKYKEVEKAFVFPNGSRIRLGYCDNDGDVLRYQGQEYDVIFIDEATHFSEYQFGVLQACVRGANNFPKRMYLTCNPGGVGHQWVKRLFIDREYRDNERAEDYEFIQAKVTDNLALMEQDPGYVQMLDNLPEDIRRAWRDGDWDLFVGQYFTEWRRETHVVEPFEIAKGWKRYFAMDYGLDMLAGYWIAVDERGRAYVYREIYEPNLIISEAARRIKELEPTGERVSVRFAPPDLWNRRQDTGRSVAEIFAEHGLHLTKASNDRAAGWLDMKEWLHPVPDEQGQPVPGLRVFENCRNLIRSIPALQYDQKNPNDCAGEPHEFTHGPDAIRYFLAGRPRPFAPPVKKPVYNFAAERPKKNPGGVGEKVRVI